MSSLADRIDRLTSAIGQAAAWLCLFMVLVQFTVVLMRYFLGVGSIWLQESILYAHGAMFLLVAAWTLAVGGHVRVDIFYSAASPRSKAWVDLFGAVFLLIPFAAAIGILSLPYAARSWVLLERSRETSGLPILFLLKTMIPVFAALLVLQGIAQIIRAGCILSQKTR